MRRPLDPYTLRWVVRLERARMKRNARYWPHDEWVFAESMLKRIIDRAARLESRDPADE